MDERPTRIPSALIIAPLLALAALLPRALGLADFLTTDEAYHWIDRTARFAAALEAGRWGDTLVTGHPGVTNMWLGMVGLALERWLGGAPSDAPALAQHLAWLRLPGATLHALVVPLAWLLLRRLIDPLAALIAAALWAGSPYLAAHARLLHLDALLTDFVTLSALLLLASQRGGRRGMPALLGAGACAGLALLTKGPALILLPFSGLALFGLALADRRAAGEAASPALIARALGQAVARYLIWLAAALLVVALLWPALWADPGRALARYVAEIAGNGGRPNGDGQFLLGQAVADPGWAFYPLANLFRATPLMLAGLALLAALWRRARPGRGELALLGLVLLWTLVMTLGPKKFDRYVLPTWPALIILAGVGWAAGLRWAGARLPRLAGRGAWAAAAILIVELAQLRAYHPYYLSYYSPLLGGGPAAQRALLIGWGEGMDQVGAWLRARPDIGYGPVLSALPPTLQPFVPVDVRDVSDYGRLPANYAVVYLESLQRAADPPLYAQLQQTEPLHRVVIHGIEYARIYQLPRPYERAVGASFGDALLLRGVTLAREPGRLVLTPAWDVRARPAGDYMVFLHLLDAAGERVAQIDLPPGGGAAPPTSAWQAGQQIAVPLPLDLPAALPPGDYRLVLGVYAPESGRLTLSGGTPADPAQAGEHALLVETIRLP